MYSKSKELLTIISNAFAEGKSELEVRNLLQNSQAVMVFGHIITELDLLTLIKECLIAKPGKAFVCTECERGQEVALENSDSIRVRFPSQSTDMNRRIVFDDICLSMSRKQFEGACEIVRAGVASRQVIPAIKKLRTVYRWGLREAKFFFDGVRDNSITVEPK